MQGGAPAECVAGGAPHHVVEIAQTPETCLGFKQALTSLHFVPREAQECKDSNCEENIQCDQPSKIIIDDEHAFIIREYNRERAAMARPVSGEAGPLVIKDKSVIINDCGASATITGSLINTSETSEKIALLRQLKGVKA